MHPEKDEKLIKFIMQTQLYWKYKIHKNQINFNLKNDRA